jgi:23S rRNA (guanine745-N1)-methyltransferase
MLADILPYLRCPVCARALAPDPGEGRSVQCPAGHRFDLARQGYVHLAAGRARHRGDTPAMIAARQAFLATGGYDFIAAAVAGAAAGRTGLVIDAGAGTGYYLARVLDALPGTVGLAVDIAKPAVRRSARAHPRAGAILADTWQRLPVADGAAGVLLNTFAPRNGAEFARVLAPGGLLLVVTPAPGHLAELASRLGEAAGVRLLKVDPDKPAQVTAGLAPQFRLAGEHIHTRQLLLTQVQVRDLISMGPSAAHTDPAALAEAVAALPEPVPVTASIRLARYLRA